MAIGFVLYIGLQLAFLGALRPSELTHGWAEISFPADAGPFAGIATVVGVGWLATLIYYYAMYVRLAPEEVRQHVADARSEAEEEEGISI